MKLATLLFERARREEDCNSLTGGNELDLGAVREIHDIKRDWEAMKKSNSECRRELRVLKGAIKAAENRCKELQKEKSANYSQIEDLQKVVTNLHREKEWLAAEMEDMMQSDKKRQQEAEMQAREIQELKRSYQETLRKYQKNEAYIRRAEEEYERLDKEGATGKRRMNALLHQEKKLQKLINDRDKQVRDLRQKCRSLIDKIRWLEQDRNACRMGWATFEVEESGRNLRDENRMLKTKLVSALEMMRQTEAAFTKLSNEAAVHHALSQAAGLSTDGEPQPQQPVSAELEMIDLPREATSTEITMLDAADTEPDKLQLYLERIMRPEDDCVDDAASDLDASITAHSARAGAMGSPRLPMPKMSMPRYLQGGKQSAPAPEPMDVHADPALIQSEWIRMIMKEHERNGTTPPSWEELSGLQVAEPSRKRAKCGSMDPEDLCLPAPIGQLDLCNSCGRAGLPPGANYSTTLSPTSYQSPLKRSRMETLQPVKLTRPTKNNVKRQNEKVKLKLDRIPNPKPIQCDHSSESSHSTVRPLSPIITTGDFPPMPRLEDDCRLLQTFRNVVQKTQRKHPQGWWPVVLGSVALLTLYSWYIVKSILETSRWMRANDVPANVLMALQEKRLTEIQWVQTLDYRMAQWLDIDRVALG